MANEIIGCRSFVLPFHSVWIKRPRPSIFRQRGRNAWDGVMKLMSEEKTNACAKWWWQVTQRTEDGEKTREKKQDDSEIERQWWQDIRRHKKEKIAWCSAWRILFALSDGRASCAIRQQPVQRHASNLLFRSLTLCQNVRMLDIFPRPFSFATLFHDWKFSFLSKAKRWWCTNGRADERMRAERIVSVQHAD